jgi:hypothetical protein
MFQYLLILTTYMFTLTTFIRIIPVSVVMLMEQGLDDNEGE